MLRAGPKFNRNNPRLLLSTRTARHNVIRIFSVNFSPITTIILNPVRHRINLPRRILTAYLQIPNSHSAGQGSRTSDPAVGLRKVTSHYTRALPSNRHLILIMGTLHSRRRFIATGPNRHITKTRYTTRPTDSIGGRLVANSITRNIIRDLRAIRVTRRSHRHQVKLRIDRATIRNLRRYMSVKWTHRIIINYLILRSNLHLVSLNRIFGGA